MIKSTLTEADYIGSHRLFRRPTRQTRINDIAFCAIISAALAYYTHMQTTEMAEALRHVTSIPLPVVVFFIAFIGAKLGGFIFSYVLFLWYERHLRKTFREDKTLQASVELSWTAEQLTSNSSYGTLMLPWKDVSGIRENEKYLLLYLSRDRYFPVIKSNFSPEQLQDFLSHLKNCPKK